MRKIAKLKFKDHDDKYRRSLTEARFRGGSESYTPQTYVSYGSRCSPSTISEICSGSFQLPRSMGGTEILCQDEQISIDHMSEEVVQVVEEQMEQMCILKKQIVEMVSAFQKKLCRCQAHGPTITPPIMSGCSCKPSSNTPCPPEMSKRRFSAGRASYDSSGYEPARVREAFAEAANHEVEGFNECLCTAQDHCYTAMDKAVCPTPESRRSCLVNSTAYPDKTRQSQRFSKVSNYFADDFDRAQTGALSARKSQRLSDVSNYLPDHLDRAQADALNTRKSQRISDVSNYIDRAQAGAFSQINEINIETQAEMSKKLADAQKQIDNLRCLFKKFVTCDCSKNQHPKGSHKIPNHLINQTDSVEAILADIRCDCKTSPPASSRFRSGAERVIPDAEISSSKEVADGEDATLDVDQKSEVQTRKPEERDIIEPVNSGKKVDTSIREVNTIKQNDVVYAADGRVIKTIAKSKRTEFIEGKNPPGTDTSIPESESKVKTPAVKTTGDKYGNKNITKSNHLHKTGPSKYLSRKYSVEAITCSESSETRINKRGKDFKQQSQTTEKQHKAKHHLVYEQGFGNAPTCKHKKKSTHKTKYSSDSIASTSTGEGHVISHGVGPVHRIKNIHIPPYNNDEYIIREYIYPREAKKRKTLLSASVEEPAYPHNVKIDSQTVSLLGCKFFNKMHQLPSTLNLGGKADSYFIEVQPKKSHSFHGISSRHNFPQKRTSTMNYAEMFKHEDVGGATAGSYFQETRAGESKAAEEAFTHRQTLYPNKSSGRQHNMTEATTSSVKPKETRKGSVGQPQLDVTVKGVSINQIPYIIKQLGGKRTAKDFFISVLPVKRPYKNFRVNVIDKDSGNLLGYFFVDEEVFHQARSKGVFDSYLSLFVLNSLASFTDFRNSVKPKVLNKAECFGQNAAN